MRKCYELDFDGEIIKLEVLRSKYLDNNRLAIVALTDDDEIFSVLTVNIAESDLIIENDCAFVDVNESWVEKFILDNDLGEPTGERFTAGFLSYPKYRFFIDKIPSCDE